MINNQITTNTQIAWLWSYDGVNYTYDPDGDSISDMVIGGISNNDIIGMMQGNIGFATQFTVAGQYQLTFQVQDANGAWSNIYKCVVNVEPADGNTRPVCNVVYTPKYLVTQQHMMISWANSTDSDPGDQIVGIGGMVVKDGVITALGDYVEQLNSTDCVLSFDKIGSYEIWVRVSDNHNAWSNWSIFTIRVESAKLSNVTIKGSTHVTNEKVWWVDDISAREASSGVEATHEGINYLLNTFGSNHYPNELPEKIVMDNFKVTGTLLTASGKPVTNTTVKIRMSLTQGRHLYAAVQTDANGDFSYTDKSPDFWLHTGYISSLSEYDYRAIGDITEKETKYIRSSGTGTNHCFPTTIYVSGANASYSEEVNFLVGYTKLQTVGWFMYVDGGWAGI